MRMHMDLQKEQFCIMKRFYWLTALQHDLMETHGT